MSERLRLADLLAGLSIASDLGFGLPREEAMRSCLIATALAREHGATDAQTADTFYAALLSHVGCSALAHETAIAFGDEHVVLGAVANANVADPADMARIVWPAVLRGRSAEERARIEHYAATPEGRAFGHRFDTGSCEVASATARRIGLGPGVERALREAVEWWNGDGPPDGLRGEEIALPARLASAGATAARFHRLGGRDAAVDALRRRSGVLLDPAVVTTFEASAKRMLAEVASGDPRERVLEVEPEPVVEVEPGDIQRIAEAFGDLADLKTPWTHGHSGAVASLVRGAAERLRLDRDSADRLEVSARLADLGRVAVSNVIWEKPGPLTSAEFEHVRMHAYHSERILAASSVLEPMARAAGMHHERMDSGGYHRGCGARELSPAVRILAAADAFQAMTEPRPHRPALSGAEAADQLKADVRAGRHDPDAVTAVLEAAGHRAPGRRENVRPAGLSDREIEVARLVAAGCSNPDIAERLVISRRTAEHHVQHIYAKVGVSSRAGLALFVHEHDLLAG